MLDKKRWRTDRRRVRVFREHNHRCFQFLSPVIHSVCSEVCATRPQFHMDQISRLHPPQAIIRANVQSRPSRNKLGEERFQCSIPGIQRISPSYSPGVPTEAYIPLNMMVTVVNLGFAVDLQCEVKVAHASLEHLTAWVHGVTRMFALRSAR